MAKPLINIASLSSERPVLIAGPTASGKSELALRIAEAQGRTVVNADALQVYDGWQVLTARPSPEDETRAPHALYGHVPFESHYSVGAWMRDLDPFLSAAPVIVGGTGLYFRALTEGLANIPETPPDIRAEGDQLTLVELLRTLDTVDPILAGRIDRQNRARVQRGWEVWRTTGRQLSEWQRDTPPPRLPLAQAEPIVLQADTDWLNDRITRRFDIMLEQGALEEARANQHRWERAGGSAKAIGAPELIAHLQRKLTLKAAREAAIIASRQYAKRQRTWFRSNMGAWHGISLP